MGGVQILRLSLSVWFSMEVSMERSVSSQYGGGD